MFGDTDAYSVESLAPFRDEIKSLQLELLGLGDTVDPIEAQRVAETAVVYPMILANRYDLVRPPIWHNALVNIGIRDRGLCFHWTADLMNRLYRLNTKSFTFYWAIANHDDSLRLEHNSVVVTAKGQDFMGGIVLDGWRDSGRLFWCPVRSDKYPWKSRTDVFVQANRPPQRD